MRYWLLMFLAALAALTPASAAAPLQLQVQQSGELIAHEGYVNISITALRPDGAPLPDAEMWVRLWHQNEFGFFTTDIPYVEGEKVYEIRTVAKNGTLEVAAMAPIPGAYRLEARAADAEGDYEPVDFSQDYTVGQLPEKQVRGPLLLMALFAAGMAGGYYFLRE